MKMQLFEKFEMLKKLNQKVKWDWQFGISKSQPQNYNIKYESEAIKSDIFVNLVKYVSKEQYKFPLDELDLGREIVFPDEAIKNNEEKLLIVFPIVSPKNEVLVSRKLKSFSITKTSKGLVLKGNVGGLRKC